MNEFKVPFAFDENRTLFNAEAAVKGPKYFCPACGNEIILRKGKIKIAHFAHKAIDSCSRETVIHKTAKYLVHSAITNWKMGNSSSPLVKRKCNICHTTIEQPIPDKVESAIIEYRLPCNFVADVALMAQEQAAAAIEIRVTHAVDELKSTSISVPFIELDGNEVLAAPYLWNPIVDKFRSFKCKTCDDNLVKMNKKIFSIATSKGISLPTSFYRYSICHCWKCNEPTIVYTWPSTDNGEILLKEPKPASIQYRFSKTTQSKYWANTCINCNSLQGDFFLFNEPDGPFYGFNCGADTPEDFHEDQIKLAYYAKYLQQI